MGGVGPRNAGANLFRMARPTYNESGYWHPSSQGSHYIALYEKAMKTGDTIKRREIYHEMQRLLQDEGAKPVCYRAPHHHRVPGQCPRAESALPEVVSPFHHQRLEIISPSRGRQGQRSWTATVPTFLVSVKTRGVPWR